MFQLALRYLLKQLDESAMELMPTATESPPAEALYPRLTEGGNFSTRIAALVSEAGQDSVVTVEAHNRYLRWILQGEDAIKYAVIIIFAVLTMAVLLVIWCISLQGCALYQLVVVLPETKTKAFALVFCFLEVDNRIRFCYNIYRSDR